MTDCIHFSFTPAGLLGFQGYHLQVFTSGRAKLSFQGEGRTQLHYYGERPKRDQEAYRRQKKRSGSLLADHFTQVDALLADLERAYVYRLHLQGNNNATADNAHLVASQYTTSVWLIMGAVVHEWDLPGPAAGCLISGSGPRVGSASLFNEFVPAYEHDWEDAVFSDEHYRRGLREEVLKGFSLASRAVATRPRPMTALPVKPDPLAPAARLPAVTPQANVPAIRHDYVDVDPAWEDPAVVGPEPATWESVEEERADAFVPEEPEEQTEPPTQPTLDCGQLDQGRYSSGQKFQPEQDRNPYDKPSRDPLMTIGRSTLHSTASLWAQLQG